MELKRIKSTFDITIGQYQEFVKIDNPDNIDVVSVFYNLDRDAVKLISHKQVDELANEIIEILNSEHKHVLKWKRFAFEPDLENMSAGAFGDAITYAQDISTAHLFTSVLYRPIVKRWFNFSKRYEIKPYEGTMHIGDKAKNLPLGLYLGANAFFFNLRNDFITAIQNRFQAKSKQVNQYLNKNDSKGIGVLLSRFMQQLEEITDNSFMKHQTNQLVK